MTSEWREVLMMEHLSILLECTIETLDRLIPLKITQEEGSWVLALLVLLLTG